jgi:hypothetical protein
MNRVIRRICSWWQAKTSRNRLYRANPALRAIDAKISDARRRHKPVRALERDKARLVTNMLRGAS